MRPSVFGNLEEWGCVLERLEELTRSRQLELHQDALVALLRYRDNWRLREAALESAATIRTPTGPLIRQVCRLMMDQGLYYQARVLAAEALGATLEHLHDDSQGEVMALRQEVRENVHALLASHDVPVIHQAARRALPKIE